MTSYKYILINGFGWSGSSALVDFFRELEGCYVPHKEFRLIKDPHGIRDLDLQLNNSTDSLNEDMAIKEFLNFIKVYSRNTGGFRPLGLAYNDDFGKQFETLSKDFVKSLTDYEYSGYWWYLDVDTPYLQYIAYKIMDRLGIYDHKEHTKMFLSIADENDFINKEKEYINSIFSELLKGKKYNTIVLDQAIPANRSSWGSRYFANCRVLVVDRDPRDVYVDLIKEKSLVGYDVAVNHDVNLFVDWFRKVRREDPVDSDYKRIQFEDLILNYDTTINDIYQYCEISPQLHVHKKERLIPDVSKKNIGMWKNHPFPEEIRKIERELGEFLVQ